MPARRDLDRDELIQLYEAGKTIEELATHFGVAFETAQARLKETGVPLRTRSESAAARHRLKREQRLPEAAVRKLFDEGASVLAMSKHFGASRGTIRERLQDLGLKLRSGSEANSLRMAKLTSQQRKALASKANEATRGRVRSEAELIKAAESRFKRFAADGAFVSPYQRDLAKALAQRGVEFAVELPVGPYNLDIAITGSSVAVELHGGGWHRYGTHWERRNKRIEYLLSRGWALVEIWKCDYRGSSGFWNADGIADKLIFLAEGYSRDPAAVCKHWMLRGDGELTAGLRSEGHDVSAVDSASRRCERTGRYLSAT